MSPEQKELIRLDPTPGFTFVNDHVYFSTEGTERVIFVHGVVFAHHDIADRGAEAYAMVSLFETGYATQHDIARAFRVSTRSLRRCQERLETGGLAAIARPDGRPVKYFLHDKAVRFLRGKLRLRQVTRLTESDHQTPVLTSRWDLRDIVIAYRMFELWRQENFFKYMRQEFLIDALADYEVEPDDPARSVSNPARKAVDKQPRMARAKLRELQETYGSTALDYLEGRSPTMKSFNAAEKKIRREIADIRDRIAELAARRKLLPTRLPLAETHSGQDVVKLSAERKHLTNILKMVAYQIESELVGRIRPHYARADDEGRSFIQAALQSSAAIEPIGNELHVKIKPLSSPHRSKALAALCDTLNHTETHFPGTELKLRFSSEQPEVS